MKESRLIRANTVYVIFSYVSICMYMCMCAYPYHIKSGLKIWSVSIDAYMCVCHLFESLLGAIQMDGTYISSPGL